MKYTNLSFFIILYFFSIINVFAQKITSQICITGEYAELTAHRKWSFNQNGRTSKTIQISAKDFGKSISYNLVCPKRCDIQENFIIHVPDPYLNPLLSKLTPLSCHESEDGKIKLEVTQGIGPFTYQWSDGVSSKNRNGLSAGIYIVTITDKFGCSIEKAFEISQPELLEDNLFDIVKQDTKCYKDNTGQVNIRPTTGSINDYSFIWEDGTDISKRSDLFAGKHKVIIKDDRRCRVELIPIGEPGPLSNHLEVTSDYHGLGISCPDAKDGEISLSISGGTAPYKVNRENSSKTWKSKGDTIILWNQLSPGIYTTTLIDANGCQAVSKVNLEAPDSIRIKSTLSAYGKYQISCKGQEDGKITISSTGGSNDFQYEWFHKDSLINKTPNLQTGAGRYKVQITDTNGCIVTSVFSLKEPRKISASKDIIRKKKRGVLVKIKPAGGIGKYTINGNFQKKIFLPYRKKTLLRIEDENGCILNKSWSFPPPIKAVTVRLKKRKKTKGNLMKCPRFNKENKSYRLLSSRG